MSRAVEIFPSDASPLRCRLATGIKDGRTSSRLVTALGLAVALIAATPPPSGAIAMVDLNRATPQQLTTLPGVGAKKAEWIVRYRERHGFRRKADLLRIKGIGLRTFRKLEPRIIVGPLPTTPPPTDTAPGTAASVKQEQSDRQIDGDPHEVASGRD